MGRHRKTWVILAVVLSLAAAGLFATSGPPPPTPNPPGTFSFAALGDAPYYVWEDIQYRLVLQDIDAHDLRWVLHVGDIFWHPCTDKHYKRSLGWFNHLRHPVIYTPGDNEWADCWEPGSGAFEPLERLHRIREIFFNAPTRSLGGKRLSLISQAQGAPFSEFVENVRWTHEGILFATVHLIGSRNGLKPFPGRTAADDVAAKTRTDAAAAWLRETFAAARAGNASAVVIGFHANPAFEEPVSDPYRQLYEPFMTVLEEEVERYGKPVLVVQGDDHVYTVDHPLVRRTTGRRLANLTRMQVPGSPEVGWVRVVVTPGAASPFAFESRVVPGWKYW
jgi:Calcineurin-like phosphoesterase